MPYAEKAQADKAQLDDIEHLDRAAVRRHRTLARAIMRRKNPPLRRSDITVTDERQVRRAVKAAALGNAMEWYDFGIYAYVAATIGKVFYSGAGDSVQMVASFATFAISFLVRPLGGMFFGPLGDRIGRKKVLALTMLLMAAGTAGIGLIPSYDTIGIWAPLLLIVCRLVQGFSTGGEYGGASTFIAEYAPDKRRGFFGSFLEFGTLAGYVVAAGLVTTLTTLLSTDAMEGWGWRIPFLLAAPLGIVGLYLRSRLDETPAFQAAHGSDGSAAGTGGERNGPLLSEDAPQIGVRQIFAKQWPTLLVCIALVGAYNVTDYMVLTYMPSYLTDTLHYEQTHGLFVLLGTMVALMVIITFVGRAADRFGRKPLLCAGMGGFLVLTIPAFLLLRQGSLAAVIAGMALLGLALVCLLGTMSAALPAMFPTSMRFGSLSIGYNIAASLFGGTTPLVLEALVSGTGDQMMPAYYVSLFAVVGLVAVALMKETAQQPLEGSPPSVATDEEAREMIRADAKEPTF